MKMAFCTWHTVVKLHLVDVQQGITHAGFGQSTVTPDTDFMAVCTLHITQEVGYTECAL